MYSTNEYKAVNYRGFFIYALIVILCCFGVIFYEDYKLISSAYNKCKKDHTHYDLFIKSDVCAITEFRHIFQSLDLIKCDDVERKLHIESPGDCAFNQYLNEGILPFIFGRWMYSIWYDVVRPNLQWILISISIIAIIIFYYNHTLKLQSRDMMVLAYTLQHQKALQPNYGYMNKSIRQPVVDEVLD